MGNIIINVDELICEAPIVLHSEWTGIRYVFSVDYSSIGDQLAVFDPSVNMQLSIEIKETIPNTTVYTGVIDNSAPFNATDYQFNILDYYVGFSGKYTLYLTLSLMSNESCNEQTVYEFPIDYP